MIRKVLIIGGGVVLVGLVICGTSALSYVRTSAGYVSEAVNDAFPIKFEIDRARGMIKDLIPEVEKNMRMIAKEEVRVKRLQERIDEAETRLTTEKANIMRLQADLKTDKDVFQYASRSYTAEQVKTDLANRFARFKTGDATLDSWRKIHTARQQSLEAAREKLEGMLAAKRQLEVEVENLEARLQMVEAAKATSQYEFDDSRLGRVKELVSNLQNRLDVADNLAKAENRFHDEIPLDETVSENIVEQVTKYFNGQTPDVDAIALD